MHLVIAYWGFVLLCIHAGMHLVSPLRRMTGKDKRFYAVPASKPLDASSLSSAELSEKLETGYADMKAGRTKPAKEVFANIRKDYGL